MDPAEWSPNGTYLGELSYIFADNPKLPIQPGNAVLTAHGSKAEILKTWVPGQKITFKFESNGLDWTKVDQVMGGGPFLLRNGLVSVDAQRQGFNDAFSNKRHPRTAMGRTATGDLWIVVIDGRQKMSDGATLEEAAKVMARLGCVDAVNLDGGGSSAINVFGVTLNRPSDGKERPVANGIVLMGTKPELASVLLKVNAPEKLALGSPTVLSVSDDAGKAVPNSEVFWSAMGDAWIDQGGMARPLQKERSRLRRTHEGRFCEQLSRSWNRKSPPFPIARQRLHPGRNQPRHREVKGADAANIPRCRQFCRCKPSPFELEYPPWHERLRSCSCLHWP